MASPISKTSALPVSPVWNAAGSARRGYVLVVGAALCWSTSGTLLKVIGQRYELSAWTLSFWRDALTFVVMLLISLRRGAGGLRLAGRDVWRLAALGALGIGILHLLWAVAVRMVPVAVATVLNYTAPAFVVLFAWWLWHEAPARRQWTALGLALAGIVLVTRVFDLRGAQFSALGLLVALSTGAGYAAFTILSKPMLRRYDNWTVLTYAFGFGALTVLALRPSAPWEMLRQPAGAWLLMAVLVLVSSVSGFGLYTAGLRRLAAGPASIAATPEPVMAAVFAFALLGEVIDPVQVLGGALVVAAVVVLAF